MTSFAHLAAGLSADAAESPSAELNLLASSPTGADLRAPTQVSARPELRAYDQPCCSSNGGQNPMPAPLGSEACVERMRSISIL